jgi:integrase
MVRTVDRSSYLPREAGEIDVLYRLSRPIPSEETTVPATARRWVEESRVWVAEKQRQGKYQGRNSYEALRFLRKCGEWVLVPPERVTESDLWTVISHVGGSAPKTRRFYLALLGSFLSARGNWVVQTSGIRRRFPNRPMNTPVLAGEERDAILNAAQGPERVVLALLANARRPIEVRRALVSDVDLSAVPPTMKIRTKGGGGQVTAVRVLNQTALRELTWWLPLRATWAGRASEDSGHLVCRWEGESLVGVSTTYLSRLLASVENRAGVPRHPLYSFRRGAATMLRERGAEWEDIRDALCHRSISTTEQYVSPLLSQKHAPAVMALLDAPNVGSG